MHYLTILPLLLAPFAAASPALNARDENTNIFDSPNYRGQHREIPVNGICVNLGPPFSTPGRGIQSLRFSAASGDNCEIHRSSNCQDYDPVVLFESQQQTRITAYSIRCAKNSNGDDDDL